MWSIKFVINDMVFLGVTFFSLACVASFFFRTNLISLLINIELAILGLNIIFVSFSLYHDDILAQFYALSILAVAAAESSLGLSLLLVFYRIRGSIDVMEVNLLKA